jgi:hypothetical protein
MNFLGEAARAINPNTALSIDCEASSAYPQRGKALIAWREKTPCKKIEDLKNVPGLDFKKIEAARPDRLLLVPFRTSRGDAENADDLETRSARRFT